MLRFPRRTIPPRIFSRLNGQRRAYQFQNSLINELKERSLISQTSSPDKIEQHVTEQRAIYLGIDPTAHALHAGHLLPYLTLLHFHLRGHRVICLVGGATGLVGDPSGRLTERVLDSTVKIGENVVSLTTAIERFFRNGRAYANARLAKNTVDVPPPTVVNNLDWYRNMSFIDFLREIGTKARVNSMLARESVQSRLNSASGISFTEFTYQLLQAHDFHHLYTRHNCTLQLGGADQWGNIVAGLDLISRQEGLRDPLSSAESEVPRTRAFAVTTPLLTTAAGEKFGKSAGNAVWLDPDLTSVFDFYQFFYRTLDADVEKYLKMFTLLSRDEIASTMAQHESAPEKRLAQRLLADELTILVHGSEALAHAHAATNALFHTDLSAVRANDLISALGRDPRLVIIPKSSGLEGMNVTKLAAEHKLVESSSAAKRLVTRGGLYLNNTRVVDSGRSVMSEDLLDRRVVILRAGKDKHLILVLASDAL